MKLTRKDFPYKLNLNQISFLKLFKNSEKFSELTFNQRKLFNLIIKYESILTKNNLKLVDIILKQYKAINTITEKYNPRFKSSTEKIKRLENKSSE